MRNEQVLVIRRELFEQLGAFQGVRAASAAEAAPFWKRENNFFLLREKAEQDPQFKQIIPYAVFYYEGRVLHYVRGGTSGEKRLIAKGSIGIGGHINDTDESLFAFDEAAYHAAVRREISEELQIEAPWTEQIVALLNDDSTEVGRVHLGIVHFARLTSTAIRPAEKAIARLEFLGRQGIEKALPFMETWSQLLVNHWDTVFPEPLA